MYVAKTKTLISSALLIWDQLRVADLGTAQLICAFVFAYSKSRFSHDAAQAYSEKTCLQTIKD